MKKITLLALISVFAINYTFSQDLTKDEKKRLRDELKVYMSDLNGYKAKKEDMQATLDSNEAEIKALKEEIISEADMRNKIAAYEAEIKKVKDENEELKSFNEEKLNAKVAKVVDQKLDSVGKAMPIAKNTSTGSTNKTSAGNNAPTASTEVVPGTVYKIQIGLYKHFNINKYFDDLKTLGYEQVDGKNRYVIGTFDNVATAKKFVEDVRKMGIKDAFVSKYVDGERVYEEVH